MHFISHSAPAAPCKALIPEFLHSLKFDFKTINDENISIAFSYSLTEFRLL